MPLIIKIVAGAGFGAENQKKAGETPAFWRSMRRPLAGAEDW